MGAHLVVISDRREDHGFGALISSAVGISFAKIGSATTLKHYLVDHPQTVVLLAADDRSIVESYGTVLIEDKHPPVKVIAITDGPLNNYPHLFDFPAFGHHVYRRYRDPAPVLYSKLASSSLVPFPFGIQRFFPSTAAFQKIELKRSLHKRAAVEAVQKTLNKHKVTTRLAALVAQATDELIMNAIFDAPRLLASGTAYRRGTERAADFELKGKEIVTLELAVAEDYMGISVSDQFGSLKKETLLGFLRRDFQTDEYKIRHDDPGAGLGIHGSLLAGLSLIFICKPKSRTEVIIIFPKADAYKSFREGFRFLSILSD